MELTKELKEKLENAKSGEEAEKILEEAGMHLDDEELKKVAGGAMDPGRTDWVGNLLLQRIEAGEVFKSETTGSVFSPDLQGHALNEQAWLQGRGKKDAVMN